MANLIIVEDSTLLGTLVVKRLSDALKMSVKWVRTFGELRALFEDENTRFDYGLIDLNLPDANGMEVVDYVIGKDIKPVVFTSDCSDTTRDLIWSRKVIDYVLKEGGYNLEYLVYLFRRVEANRKVKILLVDDSAVYREQLSGVLRTHNFTVIPCESAEIALEMLEAESDIRLVLTDYTMEHMDGFELVKQIRKKYPKDRLAIIGMSYRGDHRLSARFLKCGADDFLDKSFTTEQLYCRVNQNVETVEMIQELKESSIRDYLTGLYNRRYLYDSGEKLMAGAQRRHSSTMVAMVDIDHFKKINDRYGHTTGDAVIQYVANQLQRRFRKGDIVARYGGEEFCILATDVEPEKIGAVLEEIRDQIGLAAVCVDKEEVEVTISIGYTTATEGLLQDLVDAADDCLYRAKESGRNQVVSD